MLATITYPDGHEEQQAAYRVAGNRQPATGTDRRRRHHVEDRAVVRTDQGLKITAEAVAPPMDSRRQRDSRALVVLDFAHRAVFVVDAGGHMRVMTNGTLTICNRWPSMACRIFHAGWRIKTMPASLPRTAGTSPEPTGPLC